MDLPAADDASTVDEMPTPDTSIVANNDLVTEDISSIPAAGRSFIIRSVGNGLALTLQDGNIMLAPLDSHGSNIWFCTETNGWLAFRNAASGTNLGWHKDGTVIGLMNWDTDQELIQVRQKREGGYDILFLHDEKLEPMVLKTDNSSAMQLQLGSFSNAFSWEFIEVGETHTRIIWRHIEIARKIPIL